MNPKVDKMTTGDLVVWNVTQGHAYFDSNFRKIGILVKKIDQFEHWIYADVLDEQGKFDRVMLYKRDNPL